MNLTLLVLALVLAWFVVARRREADKQAEKDAREAHKIDKRTSIKPARSRHSQLTSEQIEKIKSIHKTFLEVYPVSLEEAKVNFQRDNDINQEIDLWLAMRASYLAVLAEKQYSDINVKKEVFQLLLMSTMFPPEDLAHKVEIKILTKSDLEYVLNDFMNRRK